jgi:hypothetical protein
MNSLTLWLPPPEIAAQLLYFLLTCYVERPLTTAFMIVVPRVLQRHCTKMFLLYHRLSCLFLLFYCVFILMCVSCPS